FSLLMSLNRPQPATIGHIAGFLAMDRTTLTAALKPLRRAKLMAIAMDPDDARSRRLVLTPAGRALLRRALPAWKRTNAQAERSLPRLGPDHMRLNLRALSGKPAGVATNR